MTTPADLWTAWLARRDERAFDALVRPELPHALHFLRRLGCGAADADDALQDALLRLASVRDDAPAAGVRAWLLREVHVRARSRLRGERRRRTREAAVAVAERSAPDGAAALRDEVERALRELGDDDRVAVELRHLHDLDYREMSRVLGVSEGACRQRVSKAIARLRSRFGDEVPALVAALPLPSVARADELVRTAISARPGSIASLRRAGSSTRGVVAGAATIVAVGVAAAVAVLRWSSAAEPGETAASDGVILVGASSPTAAPGARGVRPGTVSVGGDREPIDPRVTPREPVRSPTITVGIVRPADDGELVSDVDVAAGDRRAQAWTADLARPERSAAVWRDVRDALDAADVTTRWAALQTVTGAEETRRREARDLVRRSIESPDTRVRLAAWTALQIDGLQAADTERLRAQILAAPRARALDLLLHLVWSLGPGTPTIDGANADVVLKLLADDERRGDVVRRIGGVKLSDAVLREVLAYARTNADAAALASQCVLGPLQDKPRDVVAFLLDRADAGDASVLPHLTTGLRREDVAYAGERLRRLARTGELAVPAIETIGRIRDAASRGWLVSVRDDESQPAPARDAARRALASL